MDTSDTRRDSESAASLVAIAWKGELELLHADWSLGSGRTVEFRLVESPDTGVVEHEFKKYQRRRGGRLGQRFHGVLVPEGMTDAAYDSELMFMGWSDSDRGRTVKFFLDEFADTHPFCGFEKRSTKTPGSIFAAVLVLLQDDGTVLDEKKEEAVTGKRRRFSADAHLMVTSPLFIQYLTERCGHTQVLEKRGLSWTPALAKQYVKTKLGIESLSDLDRDAAALAKFHETIRIPYSKFTGRDQ